nr:polysaccharide pyruvyl transferase family protein [uncultured Macellibacteroides sp.]
MNIVIITQPLTTNYGGILQNYALQKTLSILGHHPITVDYGKVTWFEYFHNLASYIKAGAKGSRPETPITTTQKETGFRSFVNRYINTSKRTTRIDWSIFDAESLDAVIVGSDQVWRPSYNYDINAMFLAPLQNKSIKKITYAASFGTAEWEFNEHQTETCANLIKSFTGVSVREKDGVELCRAHLCVDAKLVLDPTLLLLKEDYLAVCSNVMKHEPFVFAYILDEDASKLKEIVEFAKSKNLPYIIKSAGPNVKENDTVEQWLSYFRDAKYIIADSFHGTVFSIIFNKDFMVYRNDSRGNSRFQTLLECFSLSDRLVNSIPNDWHEINWKKVNEHHDFVKDESIYWLKNQLSK